MKEKDYFATISIFSKNDNNKLKQEKDNSSFLSRILYNSSEQKGKIKLNHNNRHFNSSNNLYINDELSPNRNIDNNICYPKNIKKNLMKNKTINNFDNDLDENFNIKIPYNINNKSSNLNSHKNILREKLSFKPITNNDINKKENNKDNEKESFFKPFNLFFNKVHKIIRNFSFEKKEKINIDTSDFHNEKTINKKSKNIETNISENKYSNNNLVICNTRPEIPKNYMIRNYSETFQSEHIYPKHKIFNQNKKENLFLKNILYGNKEYSNKNTELNKQFHSFYKKDLHLLFNKNHHYIKNIVERLPQSKNKYLKNFLNNENKKNNSKLNNKDNNIDSLNKFNNNYFKKNFQNNSLGSDSDDNVNENIKEGKDSKYLSAGNQKNKKDLMYNFLKNSEVSSNFFLKDNNLFNKSNHTFKKKNYNMKTKVFKSSSLKYASISVKNKKYSEFIFNLYNIKFKHLLLEFLDTKTILNLSYTCTEFFKMTRNHFYTYFFNRLILDKKKNEYIHKILTNVNRYCSEQIKLSIENHKIKTFYSKLSEKNIIYNELILKDLTRTMPGDASFFKGQENYNKLYKILTSYSNYNKKIGYVQGLNFICAHAIYLFKSEEEVFVFFEGFINLMEMNKYLGLGDENKLNYKLKELSRILKRHIPEIVNYFNDIGINHEFFTNGWILTLFSSYIERDYLIII